MGIVKHFEEKKVDLEVSDEYGETPLHHAVYFGHSDLVKYLIGKNVNVNVRDNIGSTALHRASWNGDLKIVNSLNDKKVHLNAIDDYGRTALHFAVMNGQFEVVKYLNKKKANLIVYDGHGNSLLDLATIENRSDLVKYLNERSYDYQTEYNSSIDHILKCNFEERMICRLTSLRGVHLLKLPVVVLDCGNGTHIVCLRCIFDVLGQVNLIENKDEISSCCIRSTTQLDPSTLLENLTHDFYHNIFTDKNKFEVFATKMFDVFKKSMTLVANIQREELGMLTYFEEEIDIRYESLIIELEGLCKRMSNINENLKKIHSKHKRLLKRLCKNKEISLKEALRSFMTKNIYYWQYYFNSIKLFHKNLIKNKTPIKSDFGYLKSMPLPIPRYRLSNHDLKLQKSNGFLQMYNNLKNKKA